MGAAKPDDQAVTVGEASMERDGNARPSALDSSGRAATAPYGGKATPEGGNCNAEDQRTATGVC